MRWLVHGNLTPAVAEALRRHGHQAQSADQIGLTNAAPPGEVVAAARKAQMDLLTADAALIESLYAEEAVAFNRSVVYLQLEGGDVEQDDAVDRLFARYKRLNPGRLYTVTATRVKIRQLPGTL